MINFLWMNMYCHYTKLFFLQPFPWHSPWTDFKKMWLLSMESYYGRLINWVLQKSCTLICQLAAVYICDWLTKVKWSYETSCLLVHAFESKLCQTWYAIKIEKVRHIEWNFEEGNHFVEAGDLIFLSIDVTNVSLPNIVNIFNQVLQSIDKAAVKSQNPIPSKPKMQIILLHFGAFSL